MSREIHHIPGRLRLRSTMTRRFPGKAPGLGAHLAALPGVRSTHISSRTGSLTVHYDPVALDPADLNRIVGAAVPVTAPVVQQRSQGAKFSKAGEVFGKAAFDVFIAKALERSVVSVLAALR
ncbi:MAG: hypothetical protein MUF20_03305 [Methylotetracoccus sp.]|jgi:hypothetical protein|nr:hypothetical protein [Methylotetracoccus sp.]